MAIGAAGGNDAQGARRMKENVILTHLTPWLMQVPTDWHKGRLDNYVDVFFSNVDKHTIDGEIPIKLCNYVDVYKNDRITSELNYMEASAERHEIKKFQIRYGDILVTKDSETPDDIAISAFVAEEIPGVICGYHLAILRARSSRIEGKYLAWLHSSKAFRAQYEANAVGVTRFGLSQHWFREVRLPLPPLPEQIRIAAYLDASCAAIDAAVNAKKKQLEALTEMKKETLHRAFNHAEWPVERVKDLAIKIGSGVTPDGGSAGYLDEGIPLLRSQNVHFDGLRLDDVAFIAPETHREMRNSQLKPHDVLLNITGASIGRCSYVPDDFGEGNVNQHVCIIRPGHRLHFRFLAEYLSSPMGHGQIMSTFTGASRQGLSHKDLGLIRIPAPSIETQSEVVASLNTAEKQRSKLFSNIESQIATLIDYRKSLIHECVTGQRRISEADVAKVERTLEQAAGLPQQ